MVNDHALRAAGLRAVPLKHDAQGRPVLIEMPARVAQMEHAAARLFATLRELSVTQLKALQPTGRYIALVDDLIWVRTLMGGEGSEDA